jgi:hypothetical protein
MAKITERYFSVKNFGGLDAVQVGMRKGKVKCGHILN